MVLSLTDCVGRVVPTVVVLIPASVLRAVVSDCTEPVGANSVVLACSTRVLMISAPLLNGVGVTVFIDSVTGFHRNTEFSADAPDRSSLPSRT